MTKNASAKTWGFCIHSRIAAKFQRKDAIRRKVKKLYHVEKGGYGETLFGGKFNDGKNFKKFIGRFTEINVSNNM